MSHSYTIGYMCGFAFSILVAVGIGYLIRRHLKKKGKAAKYDERQKYEQARAGQFAFWVILVLVFIAATADNIGEIAVEPIVYLASCFIGLTIWASYCIIKEAYFGINQSALKWTLIVLAGGLVNGYIYFGTSNHNSVTLVNLMCAIMCTFLPILSGIKYMYNKHVEKKLEAEEAAELEMIAEENHKENYEEETV